MSSQLRTIYFVQAGLFGPVKIGITNNLERMLEQARRFNPARLRILGIIPDQTAANEAVIQRRFEHHKIRGEWFWPADDLLAFVERETEPCELQA